LWIILPQLPECQDYRCVPLCTAVSSLCLSIFCISYFSGRVCFCSDWPGTTILLPMPHVQLGLL
jgi:hypothetical protein